MTTSDAHTHNMAHILDGNGLHKSQVMEFTHSHENGVTPHHHLTDDIPIPEDQKENKGKRPHWLDQM